MLDATVTRLSIADRIAVIERNDTHKTERLRSLLEQARAILAPIEKTLLEAAALGLDTKIEYLPPKPGAENIVVNLTCVPFSVEPLGVVRVVGDALAVHRLVVDSAKELMLFAVYGDAPRVYELTAVDKLDGEIAEALAQHIVGLRHRDLV